MPFLSVCGAFMSLMPEFPRKSTFKTVRLHFLAYSYQLCSNPITDIYMNDYLSPLRNLYHGSVGCRL